MTAAFPKPAATIFRHRCRNSAFSACLRATLTRSTRDGPSLPKFVIQKIKKAPEATRSLEADARSPAQQPAFQGVTPPLPLARQSWGWLARIMGRKAHGIPSIPPANLLKDRPADPTIPIVTHDINEYIGADFLVAY